MEIRFNCPYCLKKKGSPDTKLHFYWNQDKKVGHCFRCGSSSKTAPEGSREEAVENRTTPVLGNYEKLYPLLNKIPNRLDVKAANRYLKSHNLTKDQAYEYDLLIAERKWLVFPAMDYFKSIQFWQKRSLFGPKVFINMSSTKPLWPNKKAHSTGYEITCLVESMANAMRLDPHMPAYCLWGKTLSESQKIRVSELGFRIVLVWLDPGETVATFKMVRELRNLGVKNVKFVDTNKNIVSKKDICDLTEDEIAFTIKESVK